MTIFSAILNLLLNCSKECKEWDACGNVVTTGINHWTCDYTDWGPLANPYGAGNRYNPNSIFNPYGKYGSRYSPNSANNPYAIDAPKLYDSQGRYRGKLSSNPYDPDSISNPYGRFGNRYSPDSINNPYGAGSPYRYDSPTNPYGQGWIIKGK